MVNYEIFITNHSGFPFYKWENPNRTTDIVNVVKFTRYPSITLSDETKRFELEASYKAALSISEFHSNTHVASIKKKPISAEQFGEEGTEQDIIFDLTVDTYMNEKNLYDRIYRVVDNIIFNEDRQRLEDGYLSEEEDANLKNVFNDSNLRIIIHEKYFDIFNKIREIIGTVKGEEKQLYEYGILGVGILSSSYNIIFFKGLKTFLGLIEGEIEKKIDIPGSFPDNDSELSEILSSTQMPINIEGGESKFAYPYEQNFNFIIHNFDIGPTILGVKEPFYLIVCVRTGFPSKETIDDLIHAIAPYLLD